MLSTQPVKQIAGSSPDVTAQNPNQAPLHSRRHFLQAAGSLSATLLAGHALKAQEPGQRPLLAENPPRVLNPLGRKPVSLIIDDSTCLVNLNKFAVPQFAEARGAAEYSQPWREWPDEIPDDFVRMFIDWCDNQGVKGKYSVVPFPACVGRLDRLLPGWSRGQLDESLALVREKVAVNWDIHPEMVTHTRVIDLATGHPYPQATSQYMENWDWTTGKSVDEIAAYLEYALRILKNVDLPCEGVTTPGGFGNQALPQLSQAVLQACQNVYATEIPHYFRHLYDEGTQSVAPRVEYAQDLLGDNPRCVVSIIGCTGDWTGGWDCEGPGQPDRFITPDFASGRMVEVLERNEPAIMVCHWTGIYFNGQHTGFHAFQEVVKRLHARYTDLIWMKPSEIARYWAAKNLTSLSNEGQIIRIHAPFACPQFTLEISREHSASPPVLRSNGVLMQLKEVRELRALGPGVWMRTPQGDCIVCWNLQKGASVLQFDAG